MDEPDFPERETTRKIIGAFYYVYNRLGHGFSEPVYQRSLAHVLERTGLAVQREHPVTVRFEDIVVGEFRLDLVVDRRVVVEVKAVERFHPAHEAQVINYLRAACLPVGLMLNFGPSAEFRRLVCSLETPRVTPRAEFPDTGGAPTRRRRP